MEGGIEFAYATAYLEGERAVATTLPLTNEPITAVGGAVHAFFANLLPEGPTTSCPSCWRWARKRPLAGFRSGSR